MTDGPNLEGRRAFQVVGAFETEGCDRAEGTWQSRRDPAEQRGSGRSSRAEGIRQSRGDLAEQKGSGRAECGRVMERVEGCAACVVGMGEP